MKDPKTAEDFKKIIYIATRLSHRFACIHPFENGNGRASRLLTNAILLRSGLWDVSIKEPKRKYLRAMRQADDGDFSQLEDILILGLLENRIKLYKVLMRKKADMKNIINHQT